MNLIEYLTKKFGEPAVQQDVYGNVYINIGDIFVGITILPFSYLDHNEYIMLKEDFLKYNEYNILISDGMDNYDFFPRRPYYRMRGKPVTEDQAFEIIRRTDNFFVFVDSIRKHEEYVGCYNFDNWLVDTNHFPQGYGWIHTDGTVGSNTITQKNPKLDDIIFEWLRNLKEFPSLDLIIALTWWDEGPVEKWEKGIDEYILNTEEYDELFYDAVRIGIYIHDKTIEILNPKETVKKYKEYNNLYGNPRKKFVPEYYGDNGINQIDIPYLKKCIEAYGLDADEEIEQSGDLKRFLSRKF